MNEELLKKIELEESLFFEFVNELIKRGLLVEVDDQPDLWYEEKCWAYKPGDSPQEEQ